SDLAPCECAKPPPSDSHPQQLRVATARPLTFRVPGACPGFRRAELGSESLWAITPRPRRREKVCVDSGRAGTDQTRRNAARRWGPPISLLCSIAVLPFSQFILRKRQRQVATFLEHFRKI